MAFELYEWLFCMPLNVLKRAFTLICGWITFQFITSMQRASYIKQIHIMTLNCCL